MPATGPAGAVAAMGEWCEYLPPVPRPQRLGSRFRAAPVVKGSSANSDGARPPACGVSRLADQRKPLANISGEMDEQALDAKRLLLADRAHARDPRCLERYGVTSFAATAAEYVHCLWHDVTIRTGEAYLPAPQLRRRLELLARWFPPDRGYALFPARGGPSYSACGAAASCSIQRRIRR